MSLFIMLNGKEELTRHVISEYIERLIPAHFSFGIDECWGGQYLWAIDPKNPEDCNIDIGLAIPAMHEAEVDDVIQLLMDCLPFAQFPNHQCENNIEFSVNSYLLEDFIICNPSFFRR